MKEKVIDLFKKVLSKGEKEIMETIAQSIEKRILKDREKRGMQQEKIEIAKNMLSKGISINLIHEVTKLSKQTIENLLPR